MRNMLTITNLSTLRRLSYLRRQSSATLSTLSFTKLDFSMKNFVDSKQYQKALDLFEERSASPTDISVNMAIKACTELHDRERGVHIIKHLSSHSLTNHFTQSSLIRFYTLTVLIPTYLTQVYHLVQCHDIDNANRVFSTVANKSNFTYTAMFKGYISNKMPEKVLDLFDTMTIEPNEFALSVVFKACAQVNDERAKKTGYELLNEMPNTFRNDIVVLNSALSMLMTFSDVEGAEHMFRCMKKKNIVSYGAMMQGYLANDLAEKALDLFEQISLHPNTIIYMIIIKACTQIASERAMKIGRKLLDQISDTLATDTIGSNSAVNMLMKFGDIKEAEHVFDLIKNKDVVSYGAMMQGYLENQMAGKTLDLLEQMSVNPNNIIHMITFKACAQLANERAVELGTRLLEQIIQTRPTDHRTFGSAIHMLMRFGDVKGAEHLFESIKNKDTSAYAAIMKAYNLNKQPLKSLQLFHKIKQQNIVPDATIFTLSTSACSQLGILAICQSLVAQIPSHLHGTQPLSNALVDMWGKAGSVENAQQIFTSIKNPDIITYTSMINAFGLNGRGLDAIHLFQQIPHHLRSEASYVCVLNSCSHSGLLNEARVIFEQVGIKTKRITTTMVDCLSRLFLFDEAEKILTEYEKFHSPYIPMYMAMLSGARNCRNTILSEKLFNRMKTLFPDQKDYLISASILLANVYSSFGDDDQAAIIQSNRKVDHGNKVTPGITWTEKDGEIVEFKAHDHSHALSNEIHAELKLIAHVVGQHGHRFDPTWITRPLAEGETVESVLCGHSEKLAIAFHFIDGRRPSFIQVTKNLRICGDCHEMTKLIAKIRQCDIVLRDANRIHHFNQNGTCSCQDHF